MRRLLGAWPVVLSLPVAYLAVRYAETFAGIALGTLWGGGFLALMFQIVRRSVRDTRLAALVIGGLLARIPVVVAHLGLGYLVFRGNVDFFGYFWHATRLGGGLLEGDLSFFDPDIMFRDGLAVALRLVALSYLVVGPSLPGLFMISGIVGFGGSYLFFRAFQVQFGESREVGFAARALFFFPSLIFWSSLIGKDSWMFFFLGWGTYCFAQLLREVRPSHVAGLLLSALFTILLRPPVGFAFVVAVAIGTFLSLPMRLWVRGPEVILRPIGYVAAAGALVGALTVASGSLKEYQGSADAAVGEGLLSFAVQTHVALADDPNAAGSSMKATITADAGLVHIAAFLPGAMFTFLFRPFLFEAHNAMALIASVDATLLLMLTTWRIRHIWAAVRGWRVQPFTTFALVTFLLFTVGLSFESNFGVIVRHRSMVLPFLFLVCATPRAATRPAEDPHASPVAEAATPREAPAPA